MFFQANSASKVSENPFVFFQEFFSPQDMKEHYVYVCLQGAFSFLDTSGISIHQSLGTAYFKRLQGGDDDSILNKFNERLLCTTRDSTFRLLYEHDFMLLQQHDVVKPFHDPRSSVSAIWTFDLDRDMLRLDKKNRNLWIPLKVVRERFVNTSEFEAYEEPPLFDNLALKTIYSLSDSKIRRQVIDEERFRCYKAFVTRILTDFAFQWRHVLRGRYNNSTFRRLANAVIRIITLDFTVKETKLNWGCYSNNLLALHLAPGWDFTSGDTVNICDTPIVVCQHGQYAEAVIEKDLISRFQPILEEINNVNRWDANEDDTIFEGDFDGLPPFADPEKIASIKNQSQMYLILTMREIALCQADVKDNNLSYISINNTKWAASERLFDGTLPPSDKAIDSLLQATLTTLSLFPLGRLPLELQEMVLEHVPGGPIERARIACFTGAGKVFDWECNGRTIRTIENHEKRTRETPVEWSIWFGEHSSGLVYR